MRFFAGKASKFLVLSAAAALLLTAGAFAAEQAVGVGATTGSSVRLRAEASTSSSILTTLDKGTAMAILSPAADGWYRVAFNGSTGFISADYVVEDQDGVFEANGRVNSDGVNVRAAATTDSEVLASVSTNAPVTVTGFADGWFAVTCQYGTEGYIRSDFVDLTNAAGTGSGGSGLVSSAMQHLGTRYVYGGASPSGFDCSGFTMYIYNQYGVSLPHTASGQWQSGKGAKIWSVGELQPGDLVFFNDPSRNAGKACSHAGIYIGGGEFIHASSANSGGVVISNLTSGYYNTYFVGGLRIL
ncbi:C40 family peptidase [Dysosmobacter sp.]|uniref:C40 family peptidase n=1 Tax=Dysosmobacter sp. TaxID=2591382 RepID=UPI002A8566D9|nr:SH3 domain-containing C40 family peptidase [Dysosmobacter sp.]MDY3280822.1 SH3 domain-containing C40 family peptidase [Dysosmobacter sp.]